MTLRKYTTISQDDAEARYLVDEIADLSIDVPRYRAVMEALGRKLATHMVKSIPVADNYDICVVCTAEDADYLAKGVIDTLNDCGMSSRVKLLCLWNDKIRKPALSLSPIIKQYKEEPTTQKVNYIIVKSIISGGCVVKTNLMRALSNKNFNTIFIASPVMVTGAQARLEQEFPSTIARHFTYFSFAEDSDGSKENVEPGIGGSVYARLGLGDEQTKNKILPDIVKTRRKKAFPALQTA